jgi:hypothetical protein
VKQELKRGEVTLGYASFKEAEWEVQNPRHKLNHLKREVKKKKRQRLLCMFEMEHCVGSSPWTPVSRE